MIELKNVGREYKRGAETVRALHGISFRLRDRELVEIVGESGSGKSTLLRLMAGMESCTQGEMLCGGKATGSFKAADWASWRSAAVGLMMGGDELFENETVALNVEIPMSLAGMSRSVRRKRTLTLLKRVGLGDRLNAYPASLTDYERRRLSVARSLANDPDAILADEPFRGLSAENAAELMSLFETIAKDRLVVLFCEREMPSRESTVRTLRLMNGRLLSDSDPWKSGEGENPSREWHRSLLGLRDGVRLSLHAARGRKGALACSILAASLCLSALGLRLSLENSLEKVRQEEERSALTLSPYTVERETLNESMLLSLLEPSMGEPHGGDGVYSASYRPALLSAEAAYGQSTEPGAFLHDIEKKTNLYSVLQSCDGSELNLYASDTSLELRKLENNAEGTLWAELPGDGSILKDQYQVVAGRWCAAYDELVLFADEQNEISDVAMAALGLSGGESGKRNFEDLCSVTYRLLLPSDYYQRGADGLWAQIRDESLLRMAVNEGIVLHVVGIVRPSENSSVHAFPATLGYPASLRQYIARSVADSEAVSAQRENPKLDIFTGLPFMSAEMRSYTNSDKANALRQMVAQGLDVPAQMAMYCRITGCSQADAAYKVSSNVLSTELSEKLYAMSDGDCAGLYNSYVLPNYSESSPERNLALLGASGGGIEKIMIYTSSLRQREALLNYVKSWNGHAIAEGRWTELIRGHDGAESLAAAPGRHNALLLSLLSAFAAVALLAAYGLLAALLNGAMERQRGTLRSLYLLGTSPTDRAELLRTEGLLLGLCCSMLGFGLTVGVSALLPTLARRLWGLRLLPGIPYLAAAVTLPGGVLLGLLASLPACRKIEKSVKFIDLRVKF